jgi:hypothetical protein
MREFLIFCVLGLALPIILLGIAWRRYDRQMRATIIAPTLSVVLLLLAIPHDLRSIVLGPDYSHRLYTTIEVNIVLVLVAAVYCAIKKRWIGAVASAMLALSWLWVGAINSVV